MLYCYGRVSTDDQENSLANQRQLLEALNALGFAMPGLAG